MHSGEPIQSSQTIKKTSARKIRSSSVFHGARLTAVDTLTHLLQTISQQINNREQ